MKRILIIGAGFLQSFVIKKAKEMGYYVIAIDKNQNAVGFNDAHEYHVVDIVDQEASLEIAKSKHIDGVLTAATDYGVLSASYIAQQLGLPGLDYEAAKMIKNKYKVRHQFFQHRVDDVSQYYEIHDLSVLDKIRAAITFPVMVKPSDGSGSKAARRVDAAQQLKEACREAIQASLIGKALIEEYIEGQEYGVESFVHHGEHHVLGIMGKYMTKPPNYAELGHCIPSQLHTSRLHMEGKVKEVVSRAMKSLGVNFGAVNMDILVTEDNRVCIIDVGARMGGNLIGSHIIPFGTGIDYMSVLIRAAAGDPIDLTADKSGEHVVTRLLALKPGVVKRLPDFEEIEAKCHVEIYPNLQAGDEIRAYRNNLDGCGYVVSVSNDMEQAVKQADEAKRLIDIGIVRE